MRVYTILYNSPTIAILKTIIDLLQSTITISRPKCTISNLLLLSPDTLISTLTAFNTAWAKLYLSAGLNSPILISKDILNRFTRKYQIIKSCHPIRAETGIIIKNCVSGLKRKKKSVQQRTTGNYD